MSAWDAPIVKELVGSLALRDFNAAESRADKLRIAKFAYDYADLFIPMPEPDLTEEWEIAEWSWVAHHAYSTPARKYIRRVEREHGVIIL